MVNVFADFFTICKFFENDGRLTLARFAIKLAFSDAIVKFDQIIPFWRFDARGFARYRIARTVSPGNKFDDHRARFPNCRVVFGDVFRSQSGAFRLLNGDALL